MCRESVQLQDTRAWSLWGECGLGCVHLRSGPTAIPGLSQRSGYGENWLRSLERMSHSFQFYSFIHKCSGLTFTFMIWMKIQWAHPDWQWEDKNLQILTVWGESGPHEWPWQGQDWGPDIQLGPCMAGKGGCMPIWEGTIGSHREILEPGATLTDVPFRMEEGQAPYWGMGT